MSTADPKISFFDEHTYPSPPRIVRGRNL